MQACIWTSTEDRVCGFSPATPLLKYCSPCRSDGLQKNLGPPTDVLPLVSPLHWAILERTGTSPSTNLVHSLILTMMRSTMADKTAPKSGKRVADTNDGPLSPLIEGWQFQRCDRHADKPAVGLCTRQSTDDKLWSPWMPALDETNTETKPDDTELSRLLI